MDVEEAPLGLSLGILSLSGAARRGRSASGRYGTAVYTARLDGKIASRLDGKSVSGYVGKDDKRPIPDS